eukprot:gene8236-10122_t
MTLEMNNNINESELKESVCIITGANEGLGKETAKIMANHMMNVILACRSMNKCEAVAKEIKETSKNDKIYCMKLDLSSFASIRSFVDEFKQLNKPLDILINNAGIYAPPYSKTEDGYESQFGVNHLGPFLLTNLLLPSLERSERPRIVVVSSRAHYRATLDFNNLSCLEKDYFGISRYNCSKLANVLFTLELQRKLDEQKSKIVVNTIHPGLVNTNLFQNLPSIWGYFLSTRLASLFVTKIEDAALAVSSLAIGQDQKYQVKGKYFSIFDEKEPSKFASDTNNGLKLWNLSCQYVGIEQDIKIKL